MSLDEHTRQLGPVDVPFSVCCCRPISVVELSYMIDFVRTFGLALCWFEPPLKVVWTTWWRWRRARRERRGGGKLPFRSHAACLVVRWAQRFRQASRAGGPTWVVGVTLGVVVVSSVLVLTSFYEMGYSILVVLAAIATTVHDRYGRPHTGQRASDRLLSGLASGVAGMVV